MCANQVLDGARSWHRVLTEKVFPQQATVLDVEQWARSLPGTLAAQSN